MAEIIQAFDLKNLTFQSGDNLLTATALATGLDESVASKEAAYTAEYLTYLLKSDNTYWVTGVTDVFLKNIIIPSTHNGKPVTGIADAGYTDPETDNTTYSFAGMSSLVSVVIPSSVKYIGYNAFQNCNNLKSVTIEDPDYYTVYFRNNWGWTDVHGYYFYDGGSPHAWPGSPLSAVDKVDGCDIYKFTFSKLNWNETTGIIFNGINDNGERDQTPDILLKDNSEFCNAVCWEMFYNYQNEVKLFDYDYPSQLAIGEGAFQNTGIETINIPYTVKSINYSAFCSSKSLHSVTFSDYCNVKEICGCAFEECEALANITIPASVKYIGYNAFACTALTEIIIPSKVENIDSYAFSGCTSLSRAVIGCENGIIYDAAFAGCISLTSVKFAYPVYENGVLTALAGESNVTAIYERAFADTALTDIAIPRSVTWIGRDAFKNVPLTDGAVFADIYGWFHTDGEIDEGYEGGDSITPTNIEAFGAKLLNEVLISSGDTSAHNMYKLDQMPAPTVTISGSELTIKDSTGIAEEFKIFVNGSWKATINAITGEITFLYGRN